MVEVTISAAITLAGAMYAYDSISNNTASMEANLTRASSVSAKSDIYNLMTRVLHETQEEGAKCVTNADIARIANGTFDSQHSRIRRLAAAGALPGNLTETAGQICQRANCYVKIDYRKSTPPPPDEDESNGRQRHQGDNPNTEVRYLPIKYTLFKAQPVAVSIGEKQTLCYDNKLALMNQRPAIKYKAFTASNRQRRGSYPSHGIVIGGFPEGAAMLANLSSAVDGGDTTTLEKHYWLDWHIRYVNFDRLPAKGTRARTQRFGVFVNTRVRNGKSWKPVVEHRHTVHYTPGCTRRDIQRSNTEKCRCVYIRGKNAHLSAFRVPAMCITRNPYSETNPITFLRQYRD